MPSTAVHTKRRQYSASGLSELARRQLWMHFSGWARVEVEELVA
ncbi:MAG: hypothetical protein ABSG64_01650 [Solirubrobacteraceae bacterium]